MLQAAAFSVHSFAREVIDRAASGRARHGGQMGGSRSIALGLGALGLLALLGLVLLMRPEGAMAVAQGASSASYVGVASCGGTTCHGRSEGDGAGTFTRISCNLPG